MSDFEDNILRKAIKAFYEGANFDALEKASGKKLKYTKTLFDSYEKDLRKKHGSKGEKEVVEETE